MAKKANLWFKNRLPYISVIDEASDFKFGLQLGLAKAHRKISLVWPWARGTPEIWGFPLHISATAEASDFKFGTQLGFGLGKLPYIWGSPLVFLQWPRCPHSVSGASCFIWWPLLSIFNACIKLNDHIR